MTRVFTLVSGTSNKFWEVDRSGSTVTVRFGRIGTNGQTQVKDLGAEGAAMAHLDRLVGEKTTKGYVEASAPPDAARGGSRRVSAGPARKTAAAVPAAKVAELVDEDRWKVPSSWWANTEPFRGRSKVQVLPEPGSASKFADLVREAAADLDAALSHPQTEEALKTAGRDYLASRGMLVETRVGEATPVGAAVVASVVITKVYDDKERGKFWLSDSQVVEPVVDVWVAEHGVPFAVQAAMHLSTLEVEQNRHVGPRGTPVLRVDCCDGRAFRELLRRLRRMLSGLDKAAYAEAVDAAASIRAEGIGARVTSSYLFPSEQAWVSADIDELVPGQCGDFVLRLFASATTGEQVEQLASLVEGDFAYKMRGEGRLIYTMAANVGPEVAPLLIRLHDSDRYGDKRWLYSILAGFPTDSAFQQLINRLGDKSVARYLLQAAERFPVRAMRLLAKSVARGDDSAAKELLRGHVVNYPHLVDPAKSADRQIATVLDAIVGEMSLEGRLEDDDVPPILASPPWENRKSKAKPVVLENLARPVAPALAWARGEKEQWQSLERGLTADWRGRPEWGKTWEQTIPRVVGDGDQTYRQVHALAAAPEELVQPLLRQPGALPRHIFDAQDSLKILLAKYGDDAAPYVTRVALRWKTTLASALLPLEGPEVAMAMASWYARTKSLRPLAMTWLARHPEAAARDLIPVALGKPGRDRTAAEATLRQLDPDVVGTVAQTYGARAVEGVAALLALDPVDHLPATMPKLPEWVRPRSLPPIHVADRSGELPVEAAANVVLMLMLCKPDEPYAGVAAVKEACEPNSLARFAWAIFERWRAADYPATDSWVLEGLAQFGNDDVVRELAPLVRVWPGERAHGRAAAAVDVLSTIGTDVALMHLHRISEKVTFKSLKTKAKEKMAAVADELGLTPEQLGDRLVPDLNLDERGTMVLDYGPRSFTVGFDEQLKPMVLDADGSRRKALPKPSATDDDVLATAAYSRFSSLKKDVRTIAQDQIRRLERAMADSRKWTRTEFRQLFVEHPLVWHLARRLVWLTFDDEGKPVSSFRIAEDRSLADSVDDETKLADDALVGIAHPLHLDQASLRAWGDTFADYEILQPFPQLTREVFAFTEAERGTRALDRYHNAVVPTGRLLGMVHRGWERGRDGAWENAVFREVASGDRVEVGYNPGIDAAAPGESPEQTLEMVLLTGGEPPGTSTFGDLDEITASEILRDLEALVSPS